MDKFIGFLLGICIVYSILGWIFMSLWNWILVSVFGVLFTITFWQAIGIIILLGFIKNLLFGK